MLRLVKLSLITFTFLATSLSATITASNWTAVGDVLTFDLTGSIPLGASIGGIGSNTLYIGLNGDTDWVTTNGTTRNITNNGGAGVRDLRTISGGYFNNGNGDFITVQTADVGAWQPGDILNSTVQLSGGSITLANLDLNQVIIAAGYTTSTARPEMTHQVGAAVPEPRMAVLFLALAALGFVAYQRRKR